MKSIFRRLILVLKVRLAALLATAEDPRQAVEVASQRQIELLGKVRQAQISMADSRDQLEAKRGEARLKLAELDEQARLAVANGRDDVARSVLHRRVVGGDELTKLELQIEETQREEQAIAQVENRLATMIETFAARQEVISARYSTAEAHVQVREALVGVSDELSGLGSALDQAERRTDRMQARASALDQLAELGVLEASDDNLEEVRMPTEADVPADAAVEERLASLKRAASRQ